MVKGICEAPRRPILQGVDLFCCLLRKDSTTHEETGSKSREEASIENIQKVVDRITLFLQLPVASPVFRPLYPPFTFLSEPTEQIRDDRLRLKAAYLSELR